MSMRSLVFACVGCLVCGQASAQDWGDEPWDQLVYGDPSFYVGAVGGLQLSDGGAGAFDHNTGYAAGGLLGMMLGRWRVEGEITYQQTDYDDAVDESFDLNITRGTIGLYYDVEPITALGGVSPYLGGGLGAANLTVEGTGDNDFEDDTTTFTLHGELGLKFQVTDKLSIAPHYRFEWIDAGGDTEGAPDDFYAHAFRTAIRLSF